MNCLTDTPSDLTRPRWSTRRSSPKVDAAGAAPVKPSIDGTGGSESRGLRLGSQRSFVTYLAGHFARPFGEVHGAIGLAVSSGVAGPTILRLDEMAVCSPARPPTHELMALVVPVPVRSHRELDIDDDLVDLLVVMCSD